MTLVPATVLTFGEAMLRLTAPSGVRIGDADRLDVHVAGAEANVAGALAQLGVSVRWASRLPRGALGRRVERELAGLGVLTDAVQWSDTDRLGLFFAEPGVGSRPGAVTYDRAQSAFAAIDALPDGLAAGARIVHLTGITPALGPRPAALAEGLVDAAAEQGALVSLDVNHRANLWSAGAAKAALEPLVARSHVLFCAERDARAVFELDGDATELLAGLAALAPDATLIVLTRGEHGCAALAGVGRRYDVPATPTAIVDRFGIGDALVAGVLWGLLAADAELALRAGVELAALKATLRGDLLRIEPGELERRLRSAPTPAGEVLR